MPLLFGTEYDGDIDGKSESEYEDDDLWEGGVFVEDVEDSSTLYFTDKEMKDCDIDCSKARKKCDRVKKRVHRRRKKSSEDFTSVTSNQIILTCTADVNRDLALSSSSL